MGLEMSLESTLARVAAIQQAFAPPAAPAPTPPSRGDFSQILASQTGQAGAAAPVAGVTSGGGVGAKIAAIAGQEVGQTEQPPGSNDSPRIAQYRSATAGAGVGPWCAYFASWAARAAGAPLGERGQGFGSVSALYEWAQRTGKAEPAGSGYKPQAGDLIIWGGRHMGIVESVGADGSIHTIEGNSSDSVARRSYGPDGNGATGYVRMS